MAVRPERFEVALPRSDPARVGIWQTSSYTCFSYCIIEKRRYWTYLVSYCSCIICWRTCAP